MSLVIPPGFANAAFQFSATLGTAPFVTTLGVDISEYGGDFVLAANELMGQYAAELGDITSSVLTLDRVQLAIGQDGPGGSVDSDRAAIPMRGSGSVNALGMSVIARKVTADIGRRGRGRMFLPGVCAASGINADGSLTTTYRNTISDALDVFHRFLENPNLVGLAPVLLHSPSADPTPTPITGLVPAPLVGWIRGRIY